MFQCMGKNSTTNTIMSYIPHIPGTPPKPFDSDIIEVELSKGEYLSQELQKIRRNVRLQFLILLREEDYRKCLFSYRDMMSYRRNHFPGDLILEKYEDCHQLPYNIQEPVIPRQLYIMLPKEKLFVPSSTFTEMYMKSKMRELMSIFMKLNAKCIRFMRYDCNEETNSLGMDIHSFVPQTHLSVVNRIDTEDKQASGFEYEMKFHPNTKPFRIDDFLNTETFYYLRQESGWQDIIRRRVDFKMIEDKYSYRNNEMKLLKGKFVSKLKLLDMSADYDWEKYKEFFIDYQIEYYQIV